MVHLLAIITLIYSLILSVDCDLCSKVGQEGGCEDSGCGSKQGYCVMDSYYRMCLCYQSRGSVIGEKESMEHLREELT